LVDTSGNGASLLRRLSRMDPHKNPQADTAFVQEDPLDPQFAHLRNNPNVELHRRNSAGYRLQRPASTASGLSTNLPSRPLETDSPFGRTLRGAPREESQTRGRRSTSRTGFHRTRTPSQGSSQSHPTPTLASRTNPLDRSTAASDSIMSPDPEGWYSELDTKKSGTAGPSVAFDPISTTIPTPATALAPDPPPHFKGAPSFFQPAPRSAPPTLSVPPNAPPSSVSAAGSATPLAFKPSAAPDAARAKGGALRTSIHNSTSGSMVPNGVLLNMDLIRPHLDVFYERRLQWEHGREWSIGSFIKYLGTFEFSKAHVDDQGIQFSEDPAAIERSKERRFRITPRIATFLDETLQIFEPLLINIGRALPEPLFSTKPIDPGGHLLKALRGQPTVQLLAYLYTTLLSRLLRAKDRLDTISDSHYFAYEDKSVSVQASDVLVSFPFLYFGLHRAFRTATRLRRYHRTAEA
jgi:hypothetical protein